MGEILGSDLLRGGAAIVSLTLAGCTYDFAAPFAGAPGGAGGGATSSVAAPSSVSGQGGGGAEDCSNGIDDDGNGAIDCADDACAAEGYTCVPAPPEGFEGPVALVRAPPGEEPSCGGAFPNEIAAGGVGALTVGASSCSACTCGSADGVVCAATLAWFSDGACDAEIDSVELVADGCIDLPDVTTVAARASTVTVTGSCTAAGGDAELGDTTFEASAKLCGTTPGSGCAEGVCAPPFEAELCVLRRGEGDCSAAGPFTVALDLHGGVDDRRGCTPCTCGAVEGATCVGTTTVYRNNDGCNGTSVVLDHDDGCDAVLAIRSYETSLTPEGGTCAPAGGELEGEASASDPITLCCLP